MQKHSLKVMPGQVMKMLESKSMDMMMSMARMMTRNMPGKRVMMTHPIKRVS
tara:strand:- start:26 stop:181 length:156 start_codon:yes stop_codon:yes gene_type:complete